MFPPVDHLTNRTFAVLVDVKTPCLDHQFTFNHLYYTGEFAQLYANPVLITARKRSPLLRDQMLALLLRGSLLFGQIGDGSSALLLLFMDFYSHSIDFHMVASSGNSLDGLSTYHPDQSD